MKKTKQKWCLRILVWLVALLVLLGVADSCRVQEDPHRTLVQGSLQETTAGRWKQTSRPCMTFRKAWGKA